MSQIATTFAPGRVFINQDGTLVIPENAELIYEGGVNALSETEGENGFPNIGSPTILRWTIGDDNLAANRLYDFNFYFLDAWFLKTGGTGGVNDRIRLEANIPPDQAGDSHFVNFELDGITAGTIVRPSVFGNRQAVDGWQATKASIPTLIQVDVTKTTGNVEGVLVVMILPFLGDRSFLAP